MAVDTVLSKQTKRKTPNVWLLLCKRNRKKKCCPKTPCYERLEKKGHYIKLIIKKKKANVFATAKKIKGLAQRARRRERDRG